MAMGSSKSGHQDELWVDSGSLPQGPGHAFYDEVNGVLAFHCFDDFVEEQCAKFYAAAMGRPSIAPGVYFRMLFAGYFEGIDSERGIAWRFEDSLTLRRFINHPLSKATPDHSTLCRTRQRIDLQTHQEIFQWVLTTLALEGLLKGKTLGVDATTLEANAAMRSIVRRDTGEDYESFLTGLAEASGIETPTREDLAKFDKRRKGKSSNKDWKHPHDPDARITKMKDGCTHMGHKAEHAVDMDTGAVVAVTVQGADKGDTKTIGKTLEEAEENLEEAAEAPDAKRQMHPQSAKEIVADKGYHANASLTELEANGKRSYISEPNRGPRKWKDEEKAQAAVYANRRRTRGKRGKELMRRRGEIVERSFAHVYDTGGMRRTHLRKHENILKRLLIHAGAFNLSLIFRRKLGAGKPKECKRRLEALKGGLTKGLRSSLWKLIAFRQRRQSSARIEYRRNLNLVIGWGR